MPSNAELAARITAALQLSLNPIAITFGDDELPAAPRFTETVPAGCSFWEHGMTQTFATVTDDHALCSIGIHTHNLSDAPATQPRELQDTLAAMIGLDYVREAEIQALPTMPRQHRHVLYGPLAEHPVTPDVVLVFANARQGLVITEAVHRVDAAMPLALGRPACALVPQVVTAGKAAMSLGCCGARAYLQTLADDIALWGFPGAKLDLYATTLDVMVRANETLTTFHQLRAQDVAAGERPGVRDSLARLSS